MKRIGVLALQGSFKLHQPHIEAMGAEYIEVIHRKDLENVDGLIIPGGESSVMLKLLHQMKLFEDLKGFSKPVWGICAGSILLARNVLNPIQESLNKIDIEIVRNSYGRQLQSIDWKVDSYEVAFIRAPRIVGLGSQVKVIEKRDQNPIWIEQGNVMATTFHPEINQRFPSPIHGYFLKML